MGVVHRQNASGDIAIGVEVEGAFVPFLALSKAKVAQYVQRHETLMERAQAGDAQATAVLGESYKPKGKGDSGGNYPASEPKEAWTHPQLDAYAADHDVSDYPSDATKAEKVEAIAAGGSGGEED